MMEGNEFLAYAKNYERAAKILLREISEHTDILKIQYDDPKMDDISLKSHEYGLFPILYTVRHYLELQMKGLILTNQGDSKIKTHNLQKLLHLLEVTIGQDRISKEVKQYVQKLHDYDFSSEALRYPYDNEGKKIELGSPEKIKDIFKQKELLKHIGWISLFLGIGVVSGTIVWLLDGSRDVQLTVGGAFSSIPTGWYVIELIRNRPKSNF